MVYQQITPTKKEATKRHKKPKEEIRSYEVRAHLLLSYDFERVVLSFSSCAFLWLSFSVCVICG
jgi:hypothetical protein